MWGYKLIGHWQESPEGVDYQDAKPEQLTDSIEESILFTRPPKMSQEEFIQFCVKIAKRYDQDAVLIGLIEREASGQYGGEDNPDMPTRTGISGLNIYVYYQNGERDHIGTNLSLNKISQGYSHMRQKRDPDEPTTSKTVPFSFVFEGILQPRGNLSRQVFTIKGILYEK